VPATLGLLRTERRDRARPGYLPGDTAAANNGRAIWTGAELSSAWNAGTPFRHAPAPGDYAGQPRRRVLVRACDLGKYDDAAWPSSLTLYRNLRL